MFYLHFYPCHSQLLPYLCLSLYKLELQRIISGGLHLMTSQLLLTHPSLASACITI